MELAIIVCLVGFFISGLVCLVWLVVRFPFITVLGFTVAILFLLSIRDAHSRPLTSSDGESTFGYSAAGPGGWTSTPATYPPPVAVEAPPAAPFYDWHTVLHAFSDITIIAALVVFWRRSRRMRLERDNWKRWATERLQIVELATERIRKLTQDMP